MGFYYRSHVLVCGGSPCVAHGCYAILKEIEQLVKKAGLDREIRVVETG